MRWWTKVLEVGEDDVAKVCICTMGVLIKGAGKR